MKNNKANIVSFCAALVAMIAILASCADPSLGGDQDMLKPGTPSKTEALDTVADDIVEKNQDDILKKYQNLTYEQIFENLQSLSISEFTREIKSVFSVLSNEDVDGVLPFATALGERINEYSEVELISMIKDSENDEFFRITLVQIYCREHSSGFLARTSQGDKEIRSLLLDDSESIMLKQNIVILLDFDDEAGKEMLRSIANGEEDILAFQAIKKLNKIDGEDAISISQNVLENYETQTPEKINAALKVMSQYYREMRIQSSFTRKAEREKVNFIELCNDIIDNYNDNAKLQDSAIFALSEMTDAQAITAIIENPNIDNSLKVYAIDQNYLTLTEMAESGSAEAIEMVCKAMDINPLKELEEPLSTCKSGVLSRNSNDVTNQVINEADKTISRIKTVGTNANSKWKDFYNGVD